MVELIPVMGSYSAEVEVRDHAFFNKLLIEFTPFKLTNGSEMCWRASHISITFLQGNKAVEFMWFPPMHRWTDDQMKAWGLLCKRFPLDFDALFDKACLDVLL